MSFISWEFALFLPLVFALYWQLPHRGRILLLFAASYVFYGWWDARFLALLLVSTSTDFFCARAISGERVGLPNLLRIGLLPLIWLSACKFIGTAQGNISTQSLMAVGVFPFAFAAIHEMLWKQSDARRGKAFLCLSLVINLGLLGFFKYFNFFADSAVQALAGLGLQTNWSTLHIILPVGISFYTFQTLSYTVDVFRGHMKPERDFITYATYLSFFPQLVAGPIERSVDLLPQLQRPAVWETPMFHRGLRLILIGLFKKVFVADNCALLAGYAFNPEAKLNGPWALLGVVAFAFQIYGDFSGYSDIARGSARLLGIHLSHNFHFPYFATGPSDFWQRWHITLSSWFRDYVYIPLGGNRGSTASTLRNLVLTMGLAGLWHGANWTFVVWGLYHGLLLVIYRMIKPLKSLEQTRNAGFSMQAVAMLVMFGFTLIGWAIFSSKSLAHLGSWFAALASWNLVDIQAILKPTGWLLLHAAPLVLLQLATWKHRDEVEVAHWHWVGRGVVYALLFLTVATSSVRDVVFIYFQF